MGEIEIINVNSGARRVIQMDGTELRDTVQPPKIEFCDKCETFKQALGGRFEESDGLPILWFCEACK